MSIQRWSDGEKHIVQVGREDTLSTIVMVLLILAFAWILTRPVTAVQHVDHWPEPVAAEAGR